MHIITDNTPLVPERTAKACDFTDRLRELTSSVRLIELAVTAGMRESTDGDSGAIVLACRKLEAEIGELADMVLPAMTADEKAIIANALNGGRS